MFKIDKKLQQDCLFISDLELSQLLIMNDSNFIWLILVPKQNNLVELIDLAFVDQIKLLQEINKISKVLKNNFKADKINIATLGNVVKQLHIHIIARFNDDAAFPKPVWGAVEAKKYHQDEIDKIIKIIKANL